MFIALQFTALQLMPRECTANGVRVLWYYFCLQLFIAFNVKKAVRIRFGRSCICKIIKFNFKRIKTATLPLANR